MIKMEILGYQNMCSFEISILKAELETLKTLILTSSEFTFFRVTFFQSNKPSSGHETA